MNKLQTMPQFHYWIALSENFMPQIFSTKREAMEEAKSIRILGDTARVCKVKLVEVK